MPKGSHLETLRFELEALKQVLVSQNNNLAAYRRSYHYSVQTRNQLQANASACVVREYEQEYIPRTERMISALEWTIDSLILRYTV